MIAPEQQAFFADFVLEAHERLNAIEGLLLKLDPGAPDDAHEAVLRVQQELHTLKGNSGMLGLTDLQARAHGMEQHLADAGPQGADVAKLLDELDGFRVALGGGPEAESETDPAHGGVRVSFETLDTLMDRLAEVVIFRNRLDEAIESGRAVDPRAEQGGERSIEAWGEVRDAWEALGKTMDVLGESIMSVRMVPLELLFGQLARIVYDEGVEAGKSVEFVTKGGDTPLDRALLEVASEALGHLVRNAVIHGVRPPEERVAAGKPEDGTVSVVASIRAEEVLIEVSDDGAGVDLEALQRIAAERGVDTSSEDRTLSALFLPGFTTKADVDLGAGRGMGLSAVMEAVRRQGGRVEVSSERGRGTSFRLFLPLNASIARALMLKADGQEYALPLAAVVESSRLKPGDGRRLNHAGVIRWRKGVLPLLDLGCSFGTADQIRQEGYVLVIEADGKSRGLLADELTGVRDIVVKGLDAILGDPPGVAGSTILGDGRAILILDPRGLVEAEPFLGGSA